MVQPDLLADIAIRGTPEGGRAATLTYLVPLRLRALVQPGQLVWVPLRRQRVQGIVLDIYDAAESWARSEGIREIADLADAEASITTAGIQLARWVARTYRGSLYDALALLLPPGVSQQAEVTWRATPLGHLADLGALPERERGILYYLRQHGETSERELSKELRGSPSELLQAYGALYERGLLARGATISAPRAQPLHIRTVRLLLAPAEVPAAFAALERAPKQAAALRWLVEQTLAWREANGDGGANEESDANPAESDANPAESDANPAGLEGYTSPEATTSRPAGFGSDPAALRSDPAALRGASPRYPVAAVVAATGAASGVLRQLAERGMVAIENEEVRRDPLAGDGVAPDIPPPLTAEQRRAWEQVSAALDERAGEQGGRGARVQEGLDSPPLLRSSAPPLLPSSTVFLLHGVTGSGKTEIYLRAIGRALRLGRQALVLVPEIALTAQLVRRFAARFPGQLAVLHSGLGLGQRYDEWRRLRRGVARVAIGSRSAVFAPLPDLGLIVIDEEHEPTYKHDNAPRYHARDTALRLAEITGSVVILGSATPSVESYYAAQGGRYRLLELRERVGTRSGADGLVRSQPLPLPPVKSVDMRRELQGGNRSIFSQPLQEALEKTLARREQAILFLNRRGVASFVMCRDCGHVLACPTCSGPLVVHFDDEGTGDRGQGTGDRGTRAAEMGVGYQVRVSQRSGAPQSPLPSPHSPVPTPQSPKSLVLLCHSCSYRALVPMICPECLSTRIKDFGVGTQRVEDEVKLLFPAARVVRWDRDSVSGRGSHQRMLDLFLNHEADVLVGTQMIAKGLDLPLVSLVGIVAADTGLHLPDFRSGERSFQLLTQVAGRAGRRLAGAQVILQTYTPEHYALQAALEHDYHAFYREEIAFRRQTGYPPFGRLVRFVYSSGSEDRCVKEAQDLAHRIAALLTQRDLPDEGLIGPAPAFFQRVRGRYRWHMLVRTSQPGTLLDALGPLFNWQVDVDPINVL